MSKIGEPLDQNIETAGFDNYLERRFEGLGSAEATASAEVFEEQTGYSYEELTDLMSGVGQITSFSSTIDFSATDKDTVAWTTGTISFPDGRTTATISSGNTGNITARTYIYWDPGIEVTLQTTTAADDSVRGGRVLLAIAINNADTNGKAEIIAFGASGTYPSVVSTTHLETGVMTVPLVITPASNTTALVNVNQTDGTNIFTVDSTNLRVGLGTSTPGVLLDINAASATQALRLRGIGDTSSEEKACTSQSVTLWNNKANIEASDNVYTTTSGTGNFDCSDFGFSSITGTIQGIEVIVEAYTDDPGGPALYFTLYGVGSGDGEQKNTAKLTAIETTYTVGGPTDLWGRTWTVDGFTNANFIVIFRDPWGGGSGLTYVDYLTVKVYYSGVSTSTTRIADLYLGGTGELILDLTPGDSTSQFFDFRSEDNEYGMVIRESDGTGTAVFANLFVVDGSPDYLSINLGTTDTNALNITSTDLVGIGCIPGTLLQLAKDGDAYLTLQNLTAENTDGGAETKIIFEDHANASLAQIQASHDGTADDTKGDLIFSTNTGSALTEALRLDSAQLATFAGGITVVTGKNITLGTTQWNSSDSIDGTAIAANTIDDLAIDWGTGANQVSALDVPITDTGDYYTGTEVETALQEIGAGTTLDAHYLKLSGGTMAADINMNNSYQVVNLQAPAANGEAIRATAKITEASMEAANDHVGDNSQAHSDYLINNGDDITSGSLTLQGGRATLGTIAQVGTLEIYDGSDHKITLTSPAIAANYTLTLPTTDGGANEIMQSDGSGNLSWVAQSGGGAATSLNNLAAVAINTSLTSDTDITDDLGTGDIRWKDIHAETINAGLTATDTLKLRGRDVNGATYVDILTITSADTVTADLNAIVTRNSGKVILDADHTALQNVHGLNITAGQTLTVTAGGTVGSAAYTASTDYATSAQGTLATNAMPKGGGTFTGDVLFTDNTLDIGANGATRPRTGYFGTSLISPLFNGLAITNNGTNTLAITAGKTLTVQDNVTISGALGTGAYATIANYATLANPTFTGTVILPKAIEIQDTSADHQYVLAVSELTADRTVTLPLLTGNDDFVFEDHAQTLTNKTLTLPTFTNGTISFNAPQGYLINGKIVPSVALSKLTVAIKGLDGNDPSASNPVYCRINNTVRSITAALSRTWDDGEGNYLNLGSAELATKETDVFPYLLYSAYDATIGLALSRIPYARIYGDFVASTTAEKGVMLTANMTGPAAGDDVELIGRFAVTLSAGAAYDWSAPTYTTANLIQRPTYETRWLDWTPTFAGFSADPTNLVMKYQIRGENIHCNIRVGTAGTSNANNYTMTAPVTSKTITNMFWYAACGRFDDNTAAATKNAGTALGSNSASLILTLDDSSTGWTTSGTKRGNFQIIYQI